MTTRSKIKEVVKHAKAVSIFADIRTSTLYDPIQNYSVSIHQDYPLDKEGWNEVKQILRKEIGAKKFRKVGNILCMYIKED